MSPDQLELVRLSFAAAAPRADELTTTFYRRLFATAPQARALFPDDLSEQRKKLASALATIVEATARPDELVPYLEKLGRRHVRYGAVAEHYPLVADTLRATLAELLGPAWSASLDEAWIAALELVSSVMLKGAADAEAAAA
jgi:hemoglobin-like flavoprotein